MRQAARYIGGGHRFPRPTDRSNGRFGTQTAPRATVPIQRGGTKNGGDGSVTMCGVTITDERRLVTVLFADLVGFTGRAEEADPEAVRELQRAYFAAVAAEVARFGGTVEKYIGDAAMALFGAPLAHDDDAERALRTALSIREVVSGIEGGLEVRIGVNTGEVVGGLAGPQPGDYTVSGDAVNVAARLQQAAAPNEILVGGTTRRLSADAFAFAPREPMTLKGRIEPVEAWRLERTLPERPRMHGGEARLVGRERELAALESALEEAREGRGLMMALVGEPGIGKSRLALEVRLRAEASGFRTAWTTSRSYASAFPYHLVSQLVTQLLPRQAGVGTADALRAEGIETSEPAGVERWAQVLDDVLDDGSHDDAQFADLSPAGRQRVLVHAIEGLLRAASAREPVLLVLDDLHWADPASLAVIEEVLTILPELRIELLATYRSNWSHGWEGRRAYEQLNLRALRPEDARRMAAELSSGSAISAALTEQVLERSAGNPLFLEELLHGDHSATSSHPHRLPATIHEMLLARLDALAPDVRRTLQLASVVGTEFSERVVVDLAEADGGETEEALRTLQAAELIVARPLGAQARTLAFRHPLIHEVAYRSLLVSTRRALHGRIGQWLEEHGGDELIPQLARHYHSSDDLDRARHYLRLAGERAHALNATREAAGWFTDAADAFVDDPERRAEMLEAAAQDVHLLGDIERATKIQLEAIGLYESAGNERAAANARRWLGRFHWLLGDPEEADRQITLAIDGLEPFGSSPELAMAYSFRAQSVMLVPDVVAGAKWARQAIEIAEETDATPALIHAYNNLGTCLLAQSLLEGAEYLRRSRELALEHNLPDDVGRAYTNLVSQGSRIFPFPYAEMERLLLEGTGYSARTVPDGIFDRWIRSAHGEFLLVSGRWREAETVLWGLNDAAAEAYLRGSILGLRGHLLAYRGKYDEAAAMTAGVGDSAMRVRDLQAVIPALSTQAAILAGLEDDAGVVAAIRRVVEVRGSIGEVFLSPWFAFEIADTLSAMLVRSPDSSALRTALEAMAAYARALADDVAAEGELVAVEVRQVMFGAAVEQLASIARRVGATFGRPSEGLPGRGDALSVLDREHRTFDAARVRLWLAEDGGSSGLAAVAASLFEELGAYPYLERTRLL